MVWEAVTRSPMPASWARVANVSRPRDASLVHRLLDPGTDEVHDERPHHCVDGADAPIDAPAEDRADGRQCGLEKRPPVHEIVVEP